MRLTLVVLLGALCLLTGGCGASKKPPVVEKDISSTSYSCQAPALAQRAQLKRALVDRAPHLERPRLTDHCGVGLNASVEFRAAGTLATVAPSLASDLGCTGRKVSRSALGRGLSYRCEVGGVRVRLTLNNYLPASDPRGPSVLGEADLVKPPASSGSN